MSIVTNAMTIHRALQNAGLDAILDPRTGYIVLAMHTLPRVPSDFTISTTPLLPDITVITPLYDVTGKVADLEETYGPSQTSSSEEPSSGLSDV